MIEEIKRLLPTEQPIYILCIGTDRSTGDCYGPMVGKMLQERGVPNVIGTLDEPCHATNIHERVAAEIPQDAFVLAIDACLGQVSSIGQIKVKEGGVKPGAGVGKELGIFGDAHIAAIVNVGGFMEYFVLQNTRLSLVMKQAEETAAALAELLAPKPVLVELPKKRKRWNEGTFIPSVIDFIKYKILRIA